MAICVTRDGPHGDLPAFTLHVTGRLDWAGGNDLAGAGVELLNRSCGPVHVCIDLGDVAEADGRGLLSVETLAEAIVAHHGEVCLSRINLAVFLALDLFTDSLDANDDGDTFDHDGPSSWCRSLGARFVPVGPDRAQDGRLTTEELE